MRARRASPQTPLVPTSTASSRFAAGHGLDLVDRSVERQDLVDACDFGLGDEVGLGEVDAVDFVDLECRPGDGQLAPLAMTWTPASGVTVRSRSRDRAEDLLRFGTGPELSRARSSAWVLLCHGRSRQLGRAAHDRVGDIGIVPVGPDRGSGARSDSPKGRSADAGVLTTALFSRRRGPGRLQWRRSASPRPRGASRSPDDQQAAAGVKAEHSIASGICDALGDQRHRCRAARRDARFAAGGGARPAECLLVAS